MHSFTNHKNAITITIVIIIASAMLISGLYFFPVSDWEYEHYYSITISANATQSYTITVPFPSGTNAQTSDSEPVYRQYYFDNLEKSYGNASYNIINSSFLTITGIGSLLLVSNFILWDTYANVSIEGLNFTNTLVLDCTPFNGQLQ